MIFQRKLALAIIHAGQAMAYVVHQCEFVVGLGYPCSHRDNVQLAEPVSCTIHEHCTCMSAFSLSGFVFSNSLS